MVKILQIGEGNFLRTFADAYFDALNKESGKANYEVHIVKPIAAGSLEKFKAQKNRYHIVLRGAQSGKATENVYKIDAVKDAFSPFEDIGKFYALAKDKEVRLVVSNTTEAGICFNAQDGFDDFMHSTFPAKLTKWLYARYTAGLDGVYILPVELIDNNADVLRHCVQKYIEQWMLPDGFAKWNERENYYCNTLVDRIVSGYPRDEKTKGHIFSLIGTCDELVSIGEPFGLWAIEKKGEIAKYIREGTHNVEVVLTDNIAYYKKRKVRVLNGSHTNLVAAGLMCGKETVYDCMQDPKLLAFVNETLREEIIPFVSSDIRSTAAFAESVIDRFFNPYLNHRLSSIALNSISKWRARVLPSFTDYYAEYKKIPRNLTLGLSYLLAMYYTKTDTLQDDAFTLKLFSEKTPLKEILQNKELWGEDLTEYNGLLFTVQNNTEEIARGKSLL